MNLAQDTHSDMAGLNNSKVLNQKLFDCLSEDMPKLLYMENEQSNNLNDQRTEMESQNNDMISNTQSMPLLIKKGNMKEQADQIINKLLKSNMQTGNFSPNVDISSLISNNILNSMNGNNNKQLRNETQSYAA